MKLILAVFALAHAGTTQEYDGNFSYNDVKYGSRENDRPWIETNGRSKFLKSERSHTVPRPLNLRLVLF